MLNYLFQYNMHIIATPKMNTVNNNQVVTPNVFPGLIQHRNNHPPHGVFHATCSSLNLKTNLHFPPS